MKRVLKVTDLIVLHHQRIYDQVPLKWSKTNIEGLFSKVSFNVFRSDH